VEEPRGTEAPTSGVVDTAARGASQSRAVAPAALLTRTVGEDGFIKWHIARPRGRWRVMKVAAVAAAAAALGVGYFALARDERAIDTTSRAAPARPALAAPVAEGRVVAPARPVNTVPAPSAGAENDPAVEAASTAGLLATGPYAVQIAAVPDDREAEQLLDWLAKEGYSAYLEPTTTGRGRLLRVRVGPLPSLEAAQGMAARLGEAGFAAPWITDVHRTDLR